MKKGSKPPRVTVDPPPSECSPTKPATPSIASKLSFKTVKFKNKIWSTNSQCNSQNSSTTSNGGPVVASVSADPVMATDPKSGDLIAPLGSAVAVAALTAVAVPMTSGQQAGGIGGQLVGWNDSAILQPRSTRMSLFSDDLSTGKSG